jgi:hypothetical protein
MRKLFMTIFVAGILGAIGLAQDAGSSQSTSQTQTESQPNQTQTNQTLSSQSQSSQTQPQTEQAQPQTNQIPDSEQQSQQQPQQNSAPASQPTPNGQAAGAAQNGASSNGASNGPTRIAAGSVIPVQLTKTIDAKKVKTGEEVDAKVTQDMKSTSGEVLVPKDTKIVGHVTEAQPRTKDQKESQLGITFERAVMKEGGDMVMPASIQAVIVPQNQSAENAAPAGGSSAPAPSGGSASGTPNSGRAGNAGSMPQASSAPPTSGDGGAAPAANNPRPQITASTQGVIGQADYKLSTPGDVSQGSVVSSEKGNVKLEGGTMLLLRVNQ